MTWLAFIAAVARALPVLLDIVSRFKASVDADVARGQGADEAVAAGLKIVASQLATADQAVAEAKAKQAAHPGSDSGFDNQFRRD